MYRRTEGKRSVANTFYLYDFKEQELIVSFNICYLVGIERT